MNLPPLRHETELLNKVAEGDTQAFRVLYDHYRKKVHGYAFHVLQSADRADDILQDVFVKVWVNRYSLVNIKSFENWLHVVVQNQVYDALKKLSRESSALRAFGDAASPVVNTTELALLDRENDKLLNIAIRNLSVQQQQIFQLSRFKGMKYEEIAALLNISPNTVKVHMVNALRALRDQLYPHTQKAGVLILYFLLRLLK